MDKKKNKRRPGNKKKKKQNKIKNKKGPAVFDEAKDRPTLDRLKHSS